MKLPDGAWDTHAHVIEDPANFPLSAQRAYDPPAASLDAYLNVLNRLGLARGVLVQPSVYGFDNRCLLDALDHADGRLRGVVVPAPDTTTSEFEAMHRRGVRGIRCNLLNPGGLHPDTVARWQPLLRDLGWHVAFHVDFAALEDPRSLVEQLALPVVFDHMGRPAPGRADPSAPGPRGLLELVRQGLCFVKLSAPYRLSNRPAPWIDVAPLAGALLEARPGACVWATDWPHTQMRDAVHLDHVLDALHAWCPGPGLRRMLLVDAPRALMGPD